MENLFFDKRDLKYCGNNVIIGKTVRIRRPELISIGDNVIIDDFCYIPCEMEIGNYVHISASVSFIGGAGKVVLGDFSGIGASCQIITASSKFILGGLVSAAIPRELSDEPEVASVHMGKFVMLGCSTVVLPGCILPEGMTTGALTLVTKKRYRPWTLYAGNPAKRLCERERVKCEEDAKRIYEAHQNIYGETGLQT